MRSEHKHLVRVAANRVRATTVQFRYVLCTKQKWRDGNAKQSFPSSRLAYNYLSVHYNYFVLIGALCTLSNAENKHDFLLYFSHFYYFFFLIS